MKSSTTCRIIVLVICAISLFCAATQAFTLQDRGRIVFDSSTGFFGLDDDSPIGLSTLRDDLEIAGFTVTDTIENNENILSVTDGVLQKARVFAIVNPNRRFETDEINRIKDWVNGGGSLFIAADHPDAITNANTLTSRFGAQFQSIHLGHNKELNVRTATVVAPSPVPIQTEHDSFLAYTLANTTGNYWYTRFKQSDKEHSQTRDWPIIMADNVGKGRVVMLGDADLLVNSQPTEKNSLFMQGLFFWLSGDEQLTIPDITLPAEMEVSAQEQTQTNVTLMVKNPMPNSVIISAETSSPFITLHESTVEVLNSYPFNVSIDLPCTNKREYVEHITFTVNDTPHDLTLTIKPALLTDDVKYLPDSFVLTKNKSAATLLVENAGVVNQTLTFEKPQFIDVTFTPSTLFLPAYPDTHEKSIETVALTFNVPGGMLLEDYITVMRVHACHTKTDYLRVKAGGAQQ